MALTLGPVAASADGGAPVLLLAGPVTFLAGQLWIVAAEAVALRLLARDLRWRESAGDVVVANLQSLLWVGLVVPLVASVAGYVLGLATALGLHAVGMDEAGGRASDWIMALTGWVYNGKAVATMWPYQLVGWFVISFFLTVRVEARVLARRWASRGRQGGVSPSKTSWILNGVSYAGLSAVVAWLVIRSAR